MEIAKRELDAVQSVVVAGHELQPVSLAELELVLVGGGMGDISLG